jgi:hypothetical protein
MEGALNIELMATGMGRHTGKMSRKLPSSAILLRVTLCCSFYDAVSIQKLHDLMSRKL